MKQVYHTNLGIRTVVVPTPVPGRKDILVEVMSSLISSGTETSTMKTEHSLDEVLRQKKTQFDKAARKLAQEGLAATLSAIKNNVMPSEDSLALSTLGYSNAGIVIARGEGVTTFNVGDRVACAGGGFASHAEYVIIPVNLAVKIPDSVSFQQAAFTTVGSIALQGIRRASVSFGETIVITGLGLLGLLSVQIAKAWGLRVIGIDLDEFRTSLAASLGADLTLSASDPELERRVIQWTSGIGVDAVVICAATKSSDPANQGLRICRKKARVVIVGDVGMSLERSAMYEKELDFVISTSYGPGRYDQDYELKGNDYPIGYVRWTENRNMQEFVRLVSEKKVDVGPLTSKVFPIEKADEAYRFLLDTSNGGIGVLFSYKEEGKSAATKQQINNAVVTSEKIGVGIIGAGGFVSGVHLPNLLKLEKHFNLIAISTATPTHAKTVGNKFKPRYITTDYREILDDKTIDMVIIGTRHNLHAQLTVEALKRGKHVFVEKPLALNAEGLAAIKEEAGRSKTRLTVGFNRRYSPYAITAKEVIRKIGGPVVINYRVNAGHISPNHWVQDPEQGGGRIIGECCHFLDLFSYFIEAEIKSIQSASVPVDSKTVTSEDNVVATISYADGSLAALSYVSVGNPGLPKERIEVFVGGTSIVVDNFECMEIFGNGSDRKLPSQSDKGLLRELDEWAKCVKGEPSLILPIEQAYRVTEAAFAIVRQLHG